ncbi:uncharacterized protein MAM_07639 [Metarhizium album ARSEF 1941]|uniref:Uncharacterized protein n=1 Tax=Metarhizium album (strain ARSEF 1941) TaxID=1081103 RepID=A0A0B2WEY9_METAS|nr:uncharacterized protein MAM_07639 [Metarhizium album ARSEF 1941]KHN94451.1 hypothetical protein MAM_07639 [Metarhizium album ARSEF 1941]
MDRLPRELIDAVLQQCIAHGQKNAVLNLRLVCRLFDRILKPSVCCTLGLDFSRMSRASHLRRPDIDALQTIGYHCKSLYIDLMVLRDEMEVEFLETVFARIPSMTDFCQTMHRKYCMNESSFTEVEYFNMVETMLFYCRGVDALRLNLPFQLVGRHCNAATMILANTLKAFACRPEEDSANLRTLVLENVTDVAICHLWMNPRDVMNIMAVVAVLEHLVMTLRRHDVEPHRAGLFGSCLWDMIEHADSLKSLCLVGMDHDDRPPRGLKQTKFWQLPIEDWRARSLPAPRVYLSNLTSLELKRMEILPECFLKAMEIFGETLEELYLNEVYLKTEQSRTWNQDSSKVLWIGMPNQRPAEDCKWMAMTLRATACRLRICRASFLAYDHYLREDTSTQPQPEFDLIDPCGLGRSVSQRFVEVVMGIRQPNMPSGEAVEFCPHDAGNDVLVQQLKPRTRPLRVDEYDTNAHQSAVDNTTSEWQKSIDGIFHNCNSGTLDELHYIAEKACQGMNEIHRRRSEWTAGNSMANEYVDNLFNIPSVEDAQDPM